MGHYCYDTRHWVEDDLDPSETIEDSAPDWAADVPPAYICAQAVPTRARAAVTVQAPPPLH